MSDPVSDQSRFSDESDNSSMGDIPSLELITDADTNKDAKAETSFPSPESSNGSTIYADGSCKLDGNCACLYKNDHTTADMKVDEDCPSPAPSGMPLYESISDVEDDRDGPLEPYPLLSVSPFGSSNLEGTGDRVVANIKADEDDTSSNSSLDWSVSTIERPALLHDVMWSHGGSHVPPIPSYMSTRSSTPSPSSESIPMFTTSDDYSPYAAQASHDDDFTTNFDNDNSATTNFDDDNAATTPSFGSSDAMYLTSESSSNSFCGAGMLPSYPVTFPDGIHRAFGGLTPTGHTIPVPIVVNHTLSPFTYWFGGDTEHFFGPQRATLSEAFYNAPSYVGTSRLNIYPTLEIHYLPDIIRRYLVSGMSCVVLFQVHGNELQMYNTTTAWFEPAYSYPHHTVDN